MAPEEAQSAAERALQVALHALHRTAAVVVADQVGADALPRVPPWWDSFARLSALVFTALRQVYRQVCPVVCCHLSFQ